MLGNFTWSPIKRRPVEGAQQLRENFRADRLLWVDPEGELFNACLPGCADCG